MSLTDMELQRLQVDNPGLQETRFPVSVKENHYTLFWQGLSFEQSQLHKVDFAMHSLISVITTAESASKWWLHINDGFINIFTPYAPKLAE